MHEVLRKALGITPSHWSLCHALAWWCACCRLESVRKALSSQTRRRLAPSGFNICHQSAVEAANLGRLGWATQLNGSLMAYQWPGSWRNKRGACATVFGNQNAPSPLWSGKQPPHMR